MKVVKISNLKLLLFTAGVLLLEVLILSVWSGVSPLIPIEYTRELANTHYFTHCSVTSNGMPFVVIEAVFKAGLLLIGALLAFSTRNIKGSFSEASQIAWTIYQTVLASVILIGIIVFISAVESTLTILVQIYLMWLCFSTLGLLFIPKFYILLQDEQDTIEASRSELPQEKSGGFSFASVAIMEKAQLRQYYFALRLQIHKAEAVLGLVRTPFAELRGVLWPTAGSNKDGAGGGGANTSTGGGELHHRSRGANTSFSGANGGETQALSPTGENRSRDGIVSDKYWQEKEQFVLSAVQRPEKETKTGFGTSSSQVSLSGRQSPQSSKFSMPAGRRAISIGVPVGTVAPAPASTPNPIASPSHVGSAANANANGAQLATSNSFSSSSGPSTPVPAQDLTNTPNTASDLLKFDDPLPGTVPTVVSVHIPDSAPSSSLSPSEDTPAPIVTDAQATSPSFSPTADSRSLATASST
ncbi:MAG: hypothetical protein Q7T57_00310 [Dehalococcoidales bacterium]|nr:hypothetical protein [Dehalococcoidales bacterium]